MPYTMRYNERTRKWDIIRKDDGKKVGSSESKSKAQASIGHRMSGEKKK